ncbi:MAG: tetratricopeptide repeat protein [Lachnospiraceae bacterium]|nr:tetratricopeptide repeat protein [Lachnospiraceae bacterium]
MDRVAQALEYREKEYTCSQDADGGIWRMIKKKILRISGTVLLLTAGVLLAGCTSSQERLEKEDAYRTIGINAMEDGDYAGAMEAFDSALAQVKSVGANEVDICYYKAAAQFASGSYGNAIETYDTLLEYNKKDASAYFLRGCVYLKSNESAKALEDFAKAVKCAEDDEMYLMIYNSLNGAGYETEARTYLEEALEKKAGKNARNYTVKGKLYLIDKQYGEAVKSLTTAVEKGDIEANLYLAQAYEALDKNIEAEECIAAYIKENPESSVAYNQLGCEELENENYSQAITYFSKGLETEEVTNEQELRSNLIAAYEYSGDFETAKELMQEYIQDFPGNAAAERENLFLGKNR